MIYTTFKQWVKGRFLETGEPRKQAYSKDELALIEMGWGYGYDAGVEAEREACAVDADWCIQNHLEQHISERILARGQA
jgi:hypothetical protein